VSTGFLYFPRSAEVEQAVNDRGTALYFLVDDLEVLSQRLAQMSGSSSANRFSTAATPR
jgi:hypothetical protein